MSPIIRTKRNAAIRVADTLNRIAGATVSESAKMLSLKWADGEISGEQMKKMLIEKYYRSIPEATHE